MDLHSTPLRDPRNARSWRIPGILGLITTLGCGGSPPTESANPPGRTSNRTSLESPDSRKNLLIVTLDTTRRDVMGFHGCSPSPTPNLDRLAADSAIFENAYTVAPLTLPAHASLLTGLYPVSLGVRDNAIVPIPSAANTLAEMLSEAGYHTGAAVAAFVLDQDFGTAQGFDRFSAPPRTPSSGQVVISERSAAQMAEVAIADLDALQEPCFYWLHLYDPHFPYRGRRPFTSDPTSEKGRRERYLEEVSEADEALGRVFDHLRSKGRLENTVVVFAADHGECLGDGKELSHGRFVHDPTMRIPMFVKAPGVTPRRIADPVSLIDIAPTVLEMLGVDSLAQVDGRDLSALLSGETEALPPRVLAMESYNLYLLHGWAPSEAVVDGSYKFLHSARDRLFDRAADPLETQDVSSQHPEVTRRLADELERHFAHPRYRIPADPPTALATLDLERLRALGYLHGDAGRSEERPADFSKLRDPEPMSDFLSRLDQAYFATGKRELDEALDSLRKMAVEEPDSSSVHELLGTYLLSNRPDRLTEAEDHLERAVEIRFGLPKAHFNLALCRQRRAEEASKAAERLGGPEKERALSRKADLLRLAAEELRIALEFEPRYPEALFNLATLENSFAAELWSSGEFEAAHALFESALGNLRLYLEVVPESHPDHQEFARQLAPLQARVDRTRLGLPPRDS